MLGCVYTYKDENHASHGMPFDIGMEVKVNFEEVGLNRVDSFELWCWKKLLGILWTAKKTNQ